MRPAGNRLPAHDRWQYPLSVSADQVIPQAAAHAGAVMPDVGAASDGHLVRPASPHRPGEQVRFTALRCHDRDAHHVGVLELAGIVQVVAVGDRDLRTGGLRGDRRL